MIKEPAGGPATARSARRERRPACRSRSHWPAP